YVDRALGQLVDHLTQNLRTLAHFLDPNEIPVVTIPRATDHYIEVVVLVIQVRMFSSQVVVDAATAEVWARQRICNRAILGNHSDVFRPVDKDPNAGEQLVDFVQLSAEVVEKLG